MTHRPFILALLLGAVMASSQAASPKEQYAMDRHDAAARYAENRAACNDERNQGQRMKCLREARSENTHALADAKARMASDGSAHRNPACVDCGKVTAVNVSERRGEGNALGVIGGGVAGALVGHQVGGGTGKDLATIAGAVGGAYAGKKIQERVTSTKVWTVEVEYDNGQRGSFTYDKDPGVQRGDRVKRSDDAIMRM